MREDICNFCGKKPAARFTFVPISNRKKVEGEIGHRAVKEPYIKMDGIEYLAVCPACWQTALASRPKCPRCGALGYDSKGMPGVLIFSSCGHVGPP